MTITPSRVRGISSRRERKSRFSSWRIRDLIFGERCAELGGEPREYPLGQPPHHALLVREVAEAPGIARLQPRAVVEQAIERNLQHSFQLAFIVDECGHRIRKV